ncbi:hypothetical protein BJV82DRAFT_714207 [Fennellomyces sp. T-0311]|nr:hypothetical protein BJV82DRAFT_714207 [Fennellomyces sp. T-0311]
MSNSRVFVVGGTGKVGSTVVRELLNCGAQVTVYARSPEKVQQPQVNVVQGDYNDLTSFRNGIVGHDRLFLLVIHMPDMDKIKHNISKTAYEAGVKQIVEINAKARTPFRHYQMVIPYTQAERDIYAIPIRGAYITLRPTTFMSNLFYTANYIRTKNILIDAADPDEKQEWISTSDVGRVAARILTDPISKHGDTAYELIGDIKTPSERAAILSIVLDRTIKYKQVSSQELYDYYIKMGSSHSIAFFMATYNKIAPPTRGLSILLGREPETFQAWATRNIEAFR